MSVNNISAVKSLIQWRCLALGLWGMIILGILLRLFEITQNSFIFYDEGMYLGHNAPLLAKIDQFPPQNWGDLTAILRLLFLSALTTAKWLWFFISNVRVFFGGADVLYFTRIVSVISGLLTLWLLYRLTRKLYRSREIALLSAAILALLPSHIFYSRLAMQESFCTMCFLLGIYLYCLKPRFSVMWFLSALAFSAVYFTNYRMIILPALLCVAEISLSWKEKRPIHWVKLTTVSLIFLALVLFFGLLNHGSNLYITTAWMGRQAQLASQEQGWQWFNVLSYPYTFLALEGWILPLLVLIAGVYALLNHRQKFFPWALVFTQMLLFTFASEKGARYLCVILPFAAMAGALAIEEIIKRLKHKEPHAAIGFVLGGLLIASLCVKSFSVVSTPLGYTKAVEYIQKQSVSGKVLATQPLVTALLAQGTIEVEPVPKTFQELLLRYAQGYRYLMLDPQAYVSWTSSQKRFTTPLADYLGFISDRLPPVVTFDHLSPALMERFVLDHNENLSRSIAFLNRNDPRFGRVYVYDLTATIAVMQKVLQSVAQ